jgi:hypothetical protein
MPLPQFQPMPLLKRRLPFDHPRADVRAECDGFRAARVSQRRPVRLVLRACQHIASSLPLVNESPPPLDWVTSLFKANLSNSLLRLELLDHFASVREARAAVESFLLAWEIDVGLIYGRRQMTFVFRNSHMVDRDPLRQSRSQLPEWRRQRPVQRRSQQEVRLSERLILTYQLTSELFRM